jgi:hypothetical protein
VADATLVIREGDGAGGEYPLDGELVLGREQGSADLVLNDPGVSRRHAAVRAQGGAITVEDLGSSNGTFVNGQRTSGEVVLAEGDEVQLGGTVLTVHGGDAATAMLGPGADATADHPGPAPPPAAPRPAPVRPVPERFVAEQPQALREPVQGPLAPNPHDASNIPALAAVFLGPLSIFLLLFGGGAAFFVSLPMAIAAIVLGTMGRRRAEAGQGHGALASIGRITGIIGVVLSVFAIVAFIVVSVVLDVTEDSLDGIVEALRDEIEGVDVPDAPEG